MSIVEKGVRSTWTSDHLETMARDFKLGDIKTKSKLFKEQRAELVSGAYKPEFLDMTYLPSAVGVGAEGEPLPIVVIEELIRRSPHRIISKTCTCRDAHNCQNHSKEIGCIHIGAATAEESDELCYHVTVEEAIDHLHKAVDDGLMPFIGHVFFDHIYWDVNFTAPFLTVCLCCECCCTNFNAHRTGMIRGDAQNRFKKLDGLKVHVDENKCIGCGTCVEKCFNHALKIENGIATWNEDMCKGCSACALSCAQKAIDITIDDVGAAVDALLKRLDPQVGGLPLDEYKMDL
ncbi:MAG: 4Fe-4S binding protein [Oscillospiraceae bacterium]|nr:4Fe-4S binding protein [Oscillospiraceae bacterium]